MIKVCKIAKLDIQNILFTNKSLVKNFFAKLVNNFSEQFFLFS